MRHLGIIECLTINVQFRLEAQPRPPPTSEMERFLTIGDYFKPLTIIVKLSISRCFRGPWIHFCRFFIHWVEIQQVVNIKPAKSRGFATVLARTSRSHGRARNFHGKMPYQIVFLSTRWRIFSRFFKTKVIRNDL